MHGTALDQLANVINGFDYDVLTDPNTGRDAVRIFYPSQGVTRTISYAYGAQLAGLTRTVASDEYANYQRMLGNNQSNDPGAAQVFAEAWSSDASNIAPNGLGLWMNALQAADVSVATTLAQQCQGALNVSALIVPTYTVTLMPGTYSYGSPNIGDTIGLVKEHRTARRRHDECA